MAEKKPGSLVIHLDEAEITRYLSDRDRGRLLLALVDYAQDGVLPEGFKGSLSMCFDVMRRSIDRNVKRYQETCERNRQNAAKRWDADATACDGMPADAPDANRNNNLTVTPNPNINKTVTPADAEREAAAQAKAAAEQELVRLRARKREMLARFQAGDKSALEALNRLELEIHTRQAAL